MRYILDNEGYVELCSKTPMQCGGRGCTEYTGEIPTGYETIEEWANKANIRAYKIVDGNLVYDANRDYKLRILFDEEGYSNSFVTRKEMGMASTEEINPYTDLYPSNQSAGGYITSLHEKFNKVGNLPTEEVNLSVLKEQNLDLIELEFIGNNFLPNTATSSANNGITYIQNKDKTINVSGVATGRSTLNLAGTDTGVRNVLTFKGNMETVNDEGATIVNSTNYLLHSLPNGVSLEFYHYDGSDRTLVGTYNGGIISFEEDTNVTQVILTVESGTSINTTIKPMLQLVGLEHPLLPMTKYAGDDARNGQYYVDGVSTQVVRKGKNLLYTPYTENNKLTNTAERWDHYWETGYKCYLEAGKVYTLSFNSNIHNGNIEVFIYHSYQAGEYFVCDGTNKFITFTAPITGYYYLRYDINEEGTSASFWNFQIEEGSTKTEYEPYGDLPSIYRPSEIIHTYKAGTYNAVVENKVYTLTIDEDLKGLPNGVGDRLWIKPDNTFEIEEKVGKFILNGINTGFVNKHSSIMTDTQGFYYFALNNKKISWNGDASRSLCTHLPYIENDNAYEAINQDCLWWEGTNDYANYASIPFTTIESANQWLQEENNNGTPVTIFYELNTTTTRSSGLMHENSEYEEYKNNTTLIDLAGNKLTPNDKITIKGNQIILIKGNGEEIYLGDTVMPRTYTPYTHTYCHQPVYVDFKYKDPRNLDITKITLEGLLSITNIETEYNFGLEDVNKVIAYANGETDLTDDELEVYDVNADGVVDKIDSAIILRMCYGYISNIAKGTLEINSTKAQRTIVLRDEEGKISTSLGLNGITTPSLSISGGKVYGEYVLYDGETTENVKLKDKVVNYDYIEIFAKTNDNYEFSTRVYSPDGKKVCLTGTFDNGDYMWVKSSLININGSTITRERTTETRIGNQIATTRSVTTMSITRVVGYRSGMIEETVEPDTPEQGVVEVDNTKTITGSTSSNYWTFKTVVKETSIDKGNRTSSVTVENYLGRTTVAGSSYFMGNLTINYECGGQTYSEAVYRNSGTVYAGGWYKLGSHTFTIEHTTEPMTINVGGSMSTSSFNPSSASASGSMTLTGI